MISQHFIRRLNSFRGNSRNSDVFATRDFYSKHWVEFFPSSNLWEGISYGYYISYVFGWRRWEWYLEQMFVTIQFCWTIATQLWSIIKIIAVLSNQVAKQDCLRMFILCDQEFSKIMTLGLGLMYFGARSDWICFTKLLDQGLNYSQKICGTSIHTNHILAFIGCLLVLCFVNHFGILDTLLD